MIRTPIYAGCRRNAKLVVIDAGLTAATLLTNAAAQVPSDSAVDTSFVSNLQGGGSSTHYYDRIWPLRDGGCVVERIDWGGVGYSTAFFHLAADGTQQNGPVIGTPSFGFSQYAD